MMGLGKPQLLSKIEVAGFIYYGNIRTFVLKNWYIPKRGTLYLKKLILSLDLQSQCFLVNVLYKVCGALTVENK